MADLVFVTDAMEAHIETIAPALREADMLEIAASGIPDPSEALGRSLRASTRAWTVVVEGIPSLMFGAAPISALSGRGAPWLLGTDAIFKIYRRFLRGCPAYVAEMLRIYPHLENYVDCRNAISVRWLKHLGFEIHRPTPYGVNGEMFHRFTMEAV